VSRQLDQGITAWMEGKSAEEAFKPWLAANPEQARDRERELRERLKAEGAAGAKPIAFEVRLYFVKAGNLVYTLETLVAAPAVGGGFLRIRGKPGDGGPFDGGTPLEKCAPEAGPFVKMARALNAAIVEKKAEGIPFVDPAKLSGAIPPAFRRQSLENLEESRKEAPAAFRAIAASGHDEVRLRLDELYFVARGKEGPLESGWIRAKLRLTPEGKVSFAFSRFEAAK